MATHDPTTEGGDESTASLPLHSTTNPPHYTLYTYWRSSCTWRIRIALHYKGLTYTPQPVNLLSGEQRSDEYGRINVMRAVPTLVVSYVETQQQVVLSESMAILEWLEETHPTPSLLPTEPNARAKVRQLALIIVADTQPPTNLKVLNHVAELTGKEDDRQKWAAKYIADGLAAYEQSVSFTAGTCSFGNNITFADLCLVPQLLNARRFGVDLTRFPTITRIESHLQSHPAFVAAHPDAQPDKPAEH